ncbi:MAG: phosphatidate cytidylyltransferase, partial [Deltaproteobacteria bacterium]|nr:phosphatidate cytidylyltransferase [Deltaproteobacteria bacterium]
MNNLTKRILSAGVILPPILALLFYGKPIHVAAFSVILSGIAAFEFANITLEKNSIILKYLTSSLSSIFAMAIGSSQKFPLITIFFIITIAPIIFILTMFKKGEFKDQFFEASKSLTAIIYTGSLFGSMALIPIMNPDNGKFWLLLLMSSVIFNDTLAYTTGKLFGKTKFSKISPNKTLEGSIGGLGGSIIAVLAVKFIFLQDLPLLQTAVFGLILGVAGQLGDLMESFIKRSFNVKDSGNIIPGHGGIFDRLDSMMTGAPVVLIFSLL